MSEQYPVNPEPQTQFEFERLMRDGMRAVKDGRKSVAARMLGEASVLNPADPRPWLWLSATTDKPEEQRYYLEHALKIQPGNQAAVRGLQALQSKLGPVSIAAGEPARSMPPPAEPQSVPAEPQEVSVQVYRCPNCGGEMEMDIRTFDLTCQRCGYVKMTDQVLAADKERGVTPALGDQSGHNWLKGRQQVTCEQCGAISLLPPGVQANHCPYCASPRVVQYSGGEIIQPQVIALFRQDEEDAKKAVRKWLGKGFFAPDDLALQAGGLHLEAGYYPFWTFDGTLEMPWRCEVNIGSSRNPNWVPRSGVEVEFFDDVVIPGIHSMSLKEFRRTWPFNLKDLLEFSPDYLAGWTALTYNYPLSDASLKAREQVVDDIRLQLYGRIEAGREKRRLDTSAPHWSDLTYKHTLLPLWVGSYVFQGKQFRILVNGQTGKVGGEKPRDTIKIILAAALGLILLFLAAFLASQFLG